MNEPFYSIGTWDTDLQAYTPQLGVEGGSINVPRSQLRSVLKQLRGMGYGAWRVKTGPDNHDSDWCVLVERTDGKSEAEILNGWKR